MVNDFVDVLLVIGLLLMAPVIDWICVKSLKRLNRKWRKKKHV